MINRKVVFISLLTLMLVFFLAACQSISSNTDNSNVNSTTDTTTDDDNTDTTTDTSADTITNDTATDTTTQDSNSDNHYPYPYTKEQLENDPKAPSKDPRDYDANGQYVPHDGPSRNPADYDANGNYKPIDQMTPEGMKQELEDMLGNSLEGE